MDSSHKAGIVKPSEWILLLFATVLLGAAVSNQRASVHLPVVPVEAKIEIPIDETAPVIDDANALLDPVLGNIKTGSETSVTIVMLQPATNLAPNAVSIVETK